MAVHTLSKAPAQLSAFVELTKPKIVSLVAVTTVLAFILAGGSLVTQWEILFWTLFGTALTGAGSSALNMYLERDYDKLMQRTHNRPIPAGYIDPDTALCMGEFLITYGLGVLLWKVSFSVAFLGLLSSFLYVFVYTPLKRKTWLNTLVGAVPGALPPVAGWIAATGHFDLGALSLFALLFVWQIPHFYSIAWIYRDDYRKGGFQMLPSIDHSGSRTFVQIFSFDFLLFPVALLPVFFGLCSWFYGISSILLGLWMFQASYKLYISRSDQAARRLLYVSLVYFPALLLALAFDSLL